MGMFASVAAAHDATFTYTPGTGVSGSCGSVTYSYFNFNQGNNQVTEYLTVGSGPTMTKLFNFNASGVIAYQPPYTFNASDTWAILSGTTGQSVTASATWTAAQALGAVSPVPPPSATFTLSCAPNLVYTGRAYDVGVQASLLGGLVKLGPLTLIDSGPIKTTATTTEGGNLLTANLLPLLLSVTASQSVSTGVGGDASTANATIESANSGILGIAATVVAANSKTSCDASTNTLTESGGTTIASLTIGGTNITIPNPIPANYKVLGIPGVASLVLNEQLPTPDNAGLQVNAIDLTIGPLANLASAHVIIGHAESDVEGC